MSKVVTVNGHQLRRSTRPIAAGVQFPRPGRSITLTRDRHELIVMLAPGVELCDVEGFFELLGQWVQAAQRGAQPRAPQPEGEERKDEPVESQVSVSGHPK